MTRPQLEKRVRTPVLSDRRFEREADRLARAAQTAPRDHAPGGPARRLGRPDAAAGERVTPAVAAVVRRPGRPLDPAVRRDAEARLGHDFGQVQVHSDRDAAASARDLGARAYTTGSHVVLGPGLDPRAGGDARRVLFHELVHVAQQGGRPGLVQCVPEVVEATEADRRAFVEATIDLLEGSASFFADERVPVDRARFDRVIDSWYTMVVDRERMIDTDLGGDSALRDRLRAAYRGAIQVLVSRAAKSLGRTEADLYRENSGRIPLWGWPEPHRLEPGFSTPIAEGRAVDPLTGNVSFGSSGFAVTIEPDITDPAIAAGAETKVAVNWITPVYSWEERGGARVVTSFTPPPPVTVNIRTHYAPGVSASDRSAYGRGTTSEDVAGGRVTPRSTSLGFHEGAHGLAFLEYIAAHPAPAFTGAVGMTETEFKAAVTTWTDALRQYNRELVAFSLAQVDCVGTTIDAHHAAEAAAGETITAVCRP